MHQVHICIIFGSKCLDPPTFKKLKLKPSSPRRGRVVLSPFDFASAGRPVPMLWFYEATVNTSQLVSALELALTSYQVLAGRCLGIEQNMI